MLTEVSNSDRPMAPGGVSFRCVPTTPALGTEASVARWSGYGLGAFPVACVDAGCSPVEGEELAGPPVENRRGGTRRLARHLGTCARRQRVTRSLLRGPRGCCAHAQTMRARRRGGAPRSLAIGTRSQEINRPRVPRRDVARARMRRWHERRDRNGENPRAPTVGGSEASGRTER